MKTTFEKLEAGDLFANEHGQIMVRGYGVWFNTGKILYCNEVAVAYHSVVCGDMGRYYVEADAPVTKINLPDDSTGE